MDAPLEPQRGSRAAIQAKQKIGERKMYFPLPYSREKQSASGHLVIRIGKGPFLTPLLQHRDPHLCGMIILAETESVFKYYFHKFCISK